MFDIQQQKLEDTLASMPLDQRMVIERYFNYLSEVSIQHHIQQQMTRYSFDSIEEYEADLAQFGETARGAAIVRLTGR